MICRVRSGTLALVAVLAAAAGCGREPPPPPQAYQPPAAPSLKLTSLPPLAGAEPGLQERIRARHASLTAVREQPGVSSADVARAYGEVGKLLIAGEFWAKAQPYFENAHALDPAQVAWPYYLGHSYRMQNDIPRALAAFEAAVRLRGDDVPALVWAGAMHLDAGRPDQAEPILRRAVSLQPASAAARTNLGRAVLARGNAREAVDHLEAALAADPKASPARYPLAMAYRQLGEAQRAEAHLKQWRDGKVFPADPLMEEVGSLLQTAVGYEVQGTRALDAGRWSEAAAHFRKGLATAPNDSTLHQNLGAAMYLGGDEQAARREFEEALRLSPGYARAHFSLGVLEESRGRDAEALARFSDAVRFDPALINARFSLADALRRTGRLEAAVEQYDTILREDPNASQARFGRAMAFVRLGRYADARAAFEDAARRHPEQPGFIHALARVLAAAPADGVRDGQRALALVQGLIEELGASPATLETLAMALAEVGQFGEAAAQQRQAIATSFGDERARILPRLREHLRRYEMKIPCRLPWAHDDPVHAPRATAAIRMDS